MIHNIHIVNQIRSSGDSKSHAIARVRCGSRRSRVPSCYEPAAFTAFDRLHRLRVQARQLRST